MISKRLAHLIAILLIIPQATYGIALSQLPQQQHHTITDTSSSLDYQGSTAQANNINVSSGADTVLQAAQVTSGPSTGSGQATGGTNIDAAGDLKLLAATNGSSSTHTETLSTDGMTIKVDGTPNDTATRRINNKAESQNQTNQVTTLKQAFAGSARLPARRPLTWSKNLFGERSAADNLRD